MRLLPMILVAALAACRPAASGVALPDKVPDAGTANGVRTSGCGVNGKPTGDFHLSVQDGQGKARDFEVLVPTSYQATRPLQLTFVFHGAGGDESVAKSFGLQDAPGAAAATIFVFPQGVSYRGGGIGWEDSCASYDMIFFDRMLAALEASYCLDASRVFIAGFSWGCDFGTAIVSCRGDRIRAFGAASCTDDFASQSDVSTYLNLPLQVIPKTAIRFTYDVAGDQAYSKASFQSTSALYRSFNQCGNGSTPAPTSPCVSYTGCRNPLIECAYAGLGHALPAQWPGETWSFFSGLP